MIRYWWLKNRDNLQRWIAWRLPHWLVMWASIRLMAHATQGKYSGTIVPEITMMDALNRWDDLKKP